MANYRPGIVFIGMETSGALRRRLQASGFETYSCDKLPSEDGGEEMVYSYDDIPLGRHLVGDVFETLDHLCATDLWPSAAVFHPDCTYLTNSAAWAYGPGPYHQKVKPGTLVGEARLAAREEAVQLVLKLRALKIATKVIENPIGHLTKRIGKPTQIVQPYQFGDDASKATCLWVYEDMELVDEPVLPLDPKRRIAGRMVPRDKAMGASDRARGNKGPEFIERWSNQTDTGQNRLSPGEDRWKDRSRTYGGIADALTTYTKNRLDLLA